MKAILFSVLVAGFFCSKVFSMNYEMQRQAEERRRQQEAQYAATQCHYA